MIAIPIIADTNTAPNLIKPKILIKNIVIVIPQIPATSLNVNNEAEISIKNQPKNSPSNPTALKKSSIWKLICLSNPSPVLVR